MYRLIPFLFVAIVLIAVSCASTTDEQLHYALSLSKENRPNLEKVIDYYANNPQKQIAARWLIANMTGHYTLWNTGIQTFADTILHKQLNPNQGNKLWDSLQKNSTSTQIRYDIEALSAEFLIDNIDRAFKAWEESPWHDEVNFDRFKRFVLPYRADKELLRIGWRDSIICTYAPIVAGAKTAKEAFEYLRKAVNSVRRNGKYDFPYVMDAVALRNHYSGICLERCVYLTAVCRAFGLPVTIDNCGKWANYSNNTHTWVALVLDDGTYTIVDDDTIAKKNNIIDASTFSLNQIMPEWYPYKAGFKKRLVKVWRQTYDINPVPVIPSQLFDEQSVRLSSPRLLDVSCEYGLNENIEINTYKDVSDIWLCSHALSNGWIAQAHAAVKNGRAAFKHIADSVLLIPMTLVNEKKIPVGNPFYMSNGKKIEIYPNTNQYLSAQITRKYPITAKWLNRYSQIPSTRLEGCNDSLFRNPDTLFTITQVPVYHNTATINPLRGYRYIRVIAERPSYANMDYLSIYDKTGTLITSDKKRLIDMGTPQKISRIDYFPWNDGNFIVPEHEYELAYWYRDRWIPINRQISTDYYLSFDSIPQGALLILHDITEGIEERPFTLHDYQQIWW